MNAKQRGIDEYTVCSSPLSMSFRGTSLSVGTCFFWAAGESVWLVTNWHNVTGVNPITQKHLSKTGAEPDRIDFDVWLNQDLNQRGQAWVRLIDDAGHATWLEHPTQRSKIDVVCLQLPAELSPHVFPINRRASTPLSVRVSDEVFVLGYPLGIGVERLALWKKASVASEPDFDVDDLPKLLIDTATASGMSGSPVIRRGTSGSMETGGMAMFSGPVTRFLGVYSGRLTSGNAAEAQLGIVWRSEVIDEIISGSRRGVVER